MTTAVASFNLGWALYASDYSRYLPVNSSKTRITIWTYLGLFLSAAWLEVLGLAVYAALGSQADASHQIYALVGGGFVGALAMIAIFVGTIAVNAINDYTGSLSVLAAGLRIWRPASAFVVGVVSFAAALWLYYGNFYNSFQNWLLLVTYWVGPWLGIVVVDWLMRKSKFDEAVVVSFSRLPSGRNALIALVVGFVASIPFMNQSLFEGPAAIALNGADVTYVAGFVVAAVLYWVMETWFGRTSVAV
jgi:NCS1 family nucleobase:cation symporter-1